MAQQPSACLLLRATAICLCLLRGVTTSRDVISSVAGSSNSTTTPTAFPSPGPTVDLISTVAGTGRTSGCIPRAVAGTSTCLYKPYGIALDSSYTNLYIADARNCKVRKLGLDTGIISTIAGNGTDGTSGDGSQATAAQLDYPSGLVLDSSSANLYISDVFAHSIRRVNLGTGIITLVAGHPGFSGSTGDAGPATSASLFRPEGLAIDSSNSNLYVADAFNNKVRKIELVSGIISTFAGNDDVSKTLKNSFSGDGGPATSAQLNTPWGLAIDSGDNYLYVADHMNHRVRRIDMVSGNISTFAGNGTTGSSGDGGLATLAALNQPYGLAIDSSGQYLYIGDYYNNKVRQVSLINNIISTFAGTGAIGAATETNGDGGVATNATLRYPSYISVDGSGSKVYIADTYNHKVRRVAITTSPSAVSTPTPGSPTAVPSTASPSTTPTATPTVTPSAGPTSPPTYVPSTAPTVSPTMASTVSPTILPSAEPSSHPTAQPSSSPSSRPTRGNALLQNPLTAEWTREYTALKIKSYLTIYVAFFVAMLALLLFVDLSRVGNKTRELLLLSALKAKMYTPVAASAAATAASDALESAVMSDIARDSARLCELSRLSTRDAFKRVSLTIAFRTVRSSDSHTATLAMQSTDDYKLLLEYLLLKRCLLGCGDVLYKGGYTVPLLGWRLPPGLAEDFWLYVYNNHSILSCCLAASGSRYSRNNRKFTITVQHSLAFFLSTVLIVVMTAAGYGSEYSQATENPGRNFFTNNAIDILLCTPMSLLLARLCDWLYKIRVFSGSMGSSMWNKIISRCLSVLLLLISLSSLVIAAMLTTGNGAGDNIGQYLYSVLVLTMILDFVHAAMAFETRFYYSVTMLHGLLNPVLIGQYYLETLLRDNRVQGRDFVEESWRLFQNSNVLVITRIAPLAAEKGVVLRKSSVNVEMHAAYTQASASDMGLSSEGAATTPASSRGSLRFEAVNPLHVLRRSDQTLASPSNPEEAPPLLSARLQRREDINPRDALLAAIESGDREEQMMLDQISEEDLMDGFDGTEEERAARRAQILTALTKRGVRRDSFLNKVVFFEERQAEQEEQKQQQQEQQRRHFVKANPLAQKGRPISAPNPYPKGPDAEEEEAAAAEARL